MDKCKFGGCYYYEDYPLSRCKYCCFNEPLPAPVQPAMSIEKMKLILDNCKYFQYVVPDYAEGRRNGMTDDETEEKANLALEDLQIAFDLLMQVEIERIERK